MIVFVICGVIKLINLMLFIKLIVIDMSIVEVINWISFICCICKFKLIVIGLLSIDIFIFGIIRNNNGIIVKIIIFKMIVFLNVVL